MSLEQNPTQLTWQRFSLLSIFKSVVLIFTVLLALSWNFLENIVTGESTDDTFLELLIDLGALGLLIGIGILSLLIIATLSIGYMKWRREGYAFSTDAVHKRSGVFVKTNESLPYQRIHTVEIERTIFDRLFHMASLKIDTGADADDAMKLGLLPYERASYLRSWLTEASSAARQGAPILLLPDEQESTSAQRERDHDVAMQSDSSLVGATIAPNFNLRSDTSDDVLIYRLSVSHLIISKILSLGFWGLVGVFAFGISSIVSILFGESVSIIAFLFVIIGVATSVISSFSQQWDTRLYISNNGVRLRAGLTTLTSKTITPERVHSITIERSLIMRLLGLWSLSITYPGIDSDDVNDGLSLTVIPAGTRGDIERVLWVFANNLGMDNPSALLNECMSARKQLEPTRIGHLDGVRFARCASVRARYINPASWKWSALVCTDEVAIKRWRTWFTDSIDILFHEHWQSLSVKQGPVARMLNVASVKAELVLGDFTAHNYSHDDAPAMVDMLRHYAKERRSGQAETLQAWRERCHAVAPSLAINEKEHV